MGCPDRSRDGRQAHRTDNAFQKLDKAKIADDTAREMASRQRRAARKRPPL